MTCPLSRFAVFLIALTLAGCGAKSDTEGRGATAKPTSTGSTTSPLDQGPRANEAPIDEELAEKGEELFKDKGCSACHGFGQKLTGPDLKGVTIRRTAKWMEQQILHPDRMTKEDPISRQLFAQFSLQMPNQGLTEAEARTVIEFLKHKDQESKAPEHEEEGK